MCQLFLEIMENDLGLEKDYMKTRYRKPHRNGGKYEGKKINM